MKTKDDVKDFPVVSSGSWTLSHISGEGGKAVLTEQTLREPWQKGHSDSHPGVLARVILHTGNSLAPGRDSRENMAHEARFGQDNIEQILRKSLAVGPGQTQRLRKYLAVKQGSPETTDDVSRA